MDQIRMIAVLLLAGFVVMVLGALFGVQGVYQQEGAQARVRIIEAQRARWTISQASVIIGLTLITTGFTLLAFQLREVVTAWLPMLGALLMIVGLISGVYYAFRLMTDPLGAYSGDYPLFEPLYNALSLAGLLLFGIAFLQAGMPAWLGYLTSGVALVYAVIFAITGSGFVAPGIVVLVGLATALTLLLRQSSI